MTMKKLKAMRRKEEGEYGRRETAPPPERNNFPHHGFGFMGGLGGFAPPPMASTRFGNFILHTTFGGFIPFFFNFQLHGFHDGDLYAGAFGFPHGFSDTFHGVHLDVKVDGRGKVTDAESSSPLDGRSFNDLPFPPYVESSSKRSMPPAQPRTFLETSPTSAPFSKPFSPIGLPSGIDYLNSKTYQLGRKSTKNIEIDTYFFDRGRPREGEADKDDEEDKLQIARPFPVKMGSFLVASEQQQGESHSRRLRLRCVSD
ncbi:uncharacterized protein HKW66_Vig0040660 [Vigna angularis]|uniref:Uncharacterized protein n=1 Tax=Phaseolus angularis TaxID=3914 RepID=A0A8T0LB97_PHAAN|nr:uncharacterized protein HKW66_Vig0040660 [Vigna angularis]